MALSDDPRWRLDGHMALVTGASAGIGMACAAALARAGAEVALVARDGEALEGAAQALRDDQPGARLRLFSADVTDPVQRRELFAWLSPGPLSIVVNNAGGNRQAVALESSEAELLAIFSANAASAFEISRLAHPLLCRAGEAAIVNIGSVSGLRHVRTGVAYGMAKAAVHQMTRNLACEWAADGIRVNAVAPWYTRTRRTSDALADPDYLDEVLAATPLARIAEPADVAAAVLFLCLPAAASITGQVLAVDGGFSAHGF